MTIRELVKHLDKLIKEDTEQKEKYLRWSKDKEKFEQRALTAWAIEADFCEYRADALTYVKNLIEKEVL